MILNVEQLKNELTARGIKPTYIRIKILSFLKANPIHPTAEAIYEKLAEEIPTISMTSVYNTLNLFCKKGFALPLTITGSETRFDGNLSPHYHFLCERCGRIYDVKGDCDCFNSEYIDSHKIKEVHGYFKGICKNCLSGKKMHTERGIKTPRTKAITSQSLEKPV